MARYHPTVVRCLKLAGVYLLVLVMLLWWWGSIHGHWAGGFVPLPYRLLVGLWSATGPFALLIGALPNPLMSRTIAFLAIWIVWFSIVLATPMRDWPLTVHFLMASAWCFVGLLQASVVIT